VSGHRYSARTIDTLATERAERTPATLAG
jgi:hypothetical protein